MSTHTPGPWQTGAAVRSRRLDPDTSIEVQDARGQMVAVLYANNRDSFDGAEDNANARLIAAAPELLIALRVLIATSECSCEGERCDSECTHVLARAAIDKAEG